jgi:hypothetical protein
MTAGSNYRADFAFFCSRASARFLPSPLRGEGAAQRRERVMFAKRALACNLPPLLPFGHPPPQGGRK